MLTVTGLPQFSRHLLNWLAKASKLIFSQHAEGFLSTQSSSSLRPVGKLETVQCHRVRSKVEDLKSVVLNEEIKNGFRTKAFLEREVAWAQHYIDLLDTNTRLWILSRSARCFLEEQHEGNIRLTRKLGHLTAPQPQAPTQAADTDTDTPHPPPGRPEPTPPGRPVLAPAAAAAAETGERRPVQTTGEGRESRA